MAIMRIRTCMIATLFAVTCLGTVFSQTPQPGTGNRRPVLVDDIRIHTLYQTEVVPGWEGIPHLSNNQQEKIEKINCEAKKKLAATSQTLTKKTFEFETLYDKDPSNSEAISKKKKEITKLEGKLEKTILDSKKKMRKLLDSDQQAFFDSLK